MNVLLMIENREERDTLREHLAKRGLTVSESKGGLGMLDDMGRFKRDLVILDRELWSRNKGVYRYFGVERVWTGIPVVVLGSDKKDIFADRHPHEKDAALNKPVNLKDLDQIIDSIQ